jgi:hypothetical protein
LKVNALVIDVLGRPEVKDAASALVVGLLADETVRQSALACLSALLADAQLSAALWGLVRDAATPMAFTRLSKAIQEVLK